MVQQRVLSLIPHRYFQLIKMRAYQITRNSMIQCWHINDFNFLLCLLYDFFVVLINFWRCQSRSFYCTVEIIFRSKFFIYNEGNFRCYNSRREALIKNILIFFLFFLRQYFISKDRFRILCRFRSPLSICVRPSFYLFYFIYGLLQFKQFEKMQERISE